MTGNYSIANSGGNTGGLLFTCRPGPPRRSTARPTAATSPAPPATRPTARTSDRRPASCGSSAATRRRPRSRRRRRLSLSTARTSSGQQLTTLVLSGLGVRSELVTINTIPTATSATRSSATRTPSWRPATPSSTTSRAAPSRPTTARAPSARPPTASTAAASPAAPPTPDRARRCRLHPQPEHRRLHALRRARRAPRSRISRASPAAAAPTPTTWSPIRSISPASRTPGPSMSTPTAWRPGRKSPCRCPRPRHTRDLGEFGLRQHGDRRLCHEQRHVCLHDQRSRHFYNPITNTGSLTGSAPARRRSPSRRRHGQQRHDQDTGAGSMGITSGTYGAITNSGTIADRRRQHRRADDAAPSARC